jgi:hypothetical protein
MSSWVVEVIAEAREELAAWPPEYGLRSLAL